MIKNLASSETSSLGLAGEFRASATGVSSSRRWSIVGLLFTASGINYLDRSSLAMALPLISAEFKLDPRQEGVLLSAFFLSYVFMQIPVGWCVDHLNIRWLYAAAFLLWSLAQGLTYFAGSLLVLIALRVLLGIGESIYLPGGTKIISLLFAPNERGLPSGIFDVGSRTGLVLEGILIPFLIVRYGWRQMFLLVGFTALLWLVPWVLVFPARLNQATLAGREHAERSGLVGLWKQLQSRNLLGICLGLFCFDYYWYVLISWLPKYLVDVRHFTLLKAGLFTSIPFFVFGAGEPIGGWIADRMIRLGYEQTRTRKLIIAIAFSAGLLLIPAALVDDARKAVALLIGASLVGLSTANLLVILQDCAPPQRVGIWTAIANLVGNTAGFIGPMATGFMIARSGSYFPSFLVASITLMIGLVAFCCIVTQLKPT
jgi:MFS transporter, ACS family, D-galactonate transporter